ncbi:MAG: hypothetical protein Q4G71_08130 [Pseudomonadota bacterium]|nr:hypothetical protein [Pseudomonadota bacterium]
MRAIELFHLRRVRDKPRALALITRYAGLPAPQAQAVLHAAIGGGKPRVHLPGDKAACACIAALAPTGFIARFAPADDFDAPQRAQAALLAVRDRLPVTISDAVGTLLLVGDWPAALDHALQHLRMHVSPDDAARVLLARTALETGLVCGVPGRG